MQAEINCGCWMELSLQTVETQSYCFLCWLSALAIYCKLPEFLWSRGEKMNSVWRVSIKLLLQRLFSLTICMNGWSITLFVLNFWEKISRWQVQWSVHVWCMCLDSPLLLGGSPHILWRGPPKLHYYLHLILNKIASRCRRVKHVSDEASIIADWLGIHDLYGKIWWGNQENMK